MNKNKNFVMKGTIVHTPTPDKFEVVEDGYLVCKDGEVAGTFQSLPDAYKGYQQYDYTGQLIIPGMVDMHHHAPQYPFRGVGQNIENANWGSWFEKYCFPTESRFADVTYAEQAYGRLTDDLLHTTISRLVMFSSLHRPATEVLMELLAKKGFAAYVGKVNMDRNSVEGLQETTDETLRETRLWLENTADKYAYVKPIITPRYTPSCTDECMRALQQLMIEYKLPVQSHLSEGLDEMAWVRELKPGIEYYYECYDEFGMFGTDGPSVMAHCVFTEGKEFELLCQRDVWVAHCPNSNMGGSGTAAPILKFMRGGAKVGLGTDSAGGNHINMLRTVSEAILASKVLWAYTERMGNPEATRDMLSLPQAFYLATKGGGSFFGKAGSFEEGSLFDAVVLDDSRVADIIPRDTYERVERMTNLGDDRDIKAKFINGVKVL